MGNGAKNTEWVSFTCEFLFLRGGVISTSRMDYYKMNPVSGFCPSDSCRELRQGELLIRHDTEAGLVLLGVPHPEVYSQNQSLFKMS